MHSLFPYWKKKIKHVHRDGPLGKMLGSQRSGMQIMRKHLAPWASLAQSNLQVAFNDWNVVGMKVECRNGLIMKSSTGGWLHRVMSISMTDSGPWFGSNSEIVTSIIQSAGEGERRWLGEFKLNLDTSVPEGQGGVESLFYGGPLWERPARFAQWRRRKWDGKIPATFRLFPFPLPSLQHSLTHTHVHTHTHSHTHTLTHWHAYIHSYTQTHAHTHTCAIWFGHNVRKDNAQETFLSHKCE